MHPTRGLPHFLRSHRRSGRIFTDCSYATLDFYRIFIVFLEIKIRDTLENVMAENSIWKAHLDKIWSLLEQGGEMRTQAYSLLDALLDSLLDAGEIDQLDRLFEGI